MATGGANLQAQDRVAFDQQISVGFDGQYKVGHWVPVRLTLIGGEQAETGHVSLTVLDGDEVPATIVSPRPFQVQPGGRVEVSMIVRLGRLDAEIQARFFDQETDRTIASRTYRESVPMALGSQQELIVAVGSALGLNEAIGRLRWEEGARPAVLLLEDLSQLPARWYGYDGVDRLILSAHQPDVYQAVTDAQWQALKEWIRQGGDVLISGGGQVPNLVMRVPEFKEFLPGEVAADGAPVIELKNVSQFEQYASSSQALLPDPDASLSVVRLKDVRGKVLTRQGADLPLVVESPFGFGKVTFVAADLSQREFIAWPGRKDFYATLFGWHLSADTSTQAAAAVPSITDLASQLRNALDQFPGVHLVRFEYVAVLIFAYIVLIGPVDYFLVKRLGGRMWLTWFTFPAIVVLVSVGAYWLAVWLKGDQLRINQAVVVDVLLERDGSGETTSAVRGTVWANLFTPQTATYDLSLDFPQASGDESEPSQREVLLSWFGLPEARALGGMHQQRSALLVPGRSYDIDLEAEELRGVPLQVWSTKSFTARWRQQNVRLIDATVQVRGDDVVRLEVHNRLSAPLEECVLAYDKWSYELADLPAGKETTLRPAPGDKQEFRHRLTELLHVYDEEKKDYVITHKPYDTTSTKVPEILRQMLFYQHVEGEEYTGLANRYQRFVDMSHYLGTRYAVLLARSSQPYAELRVEGADIDGNDTGSQATIYRFLIPVTELDDPTK